jgi:thioredoxin reductase (NADPH)
VDIMVAHALEYVQIFQGEEVVDILPGDPITVQTSRRKFKTRTVLLATGASHRHLGVPGEKRLSGRGVSYCATCDGPLFRGRRVIMVGGGNSAVTAATACGPRRIWSETWKRPGLRYAGTPRWKRSWAPSGSRPCA